MKNDKTILLGIINNKRIPVGLVVRITALSRRRLEFKSQTER